MKKTKKQKTQNKPSGKKEGVIYVASNNVGYVDVEGFEEDIQIQPQFLNTALHGDTVRIALLPKGKKDTRMQGEVVDVLERAKDELIGTIDRKDPKKKLCLSCAR